MSHAAAASSDPFDIAVIGAGVVGCAVFREFVLAGARTVLIERRSDIIEGASKGNSALLHTGFDAVPGTLEARCVADGYARYQLVRERLNLPLLASGALLVAWTPEQAAALPAIVERAHRNGVHDVVPVAADAVRAREPALAADPVGGVWVPGEAIIDPWSAPLAYALQGVANGGVVRRNAELRSGAFADGVWSLVLASGERIMARTVINCAGNHGDIVEAIARPSPFHIRPRKGQFVVYDKPAYDLVRAIILPVPNERTKGVVVARTIFGNLLVGPTAEDGDERDLATTDAATLADLAIAGERIVPALADQDVVTAYAGLRPATEHKDYQIEALPRQAWISVGGIRSTGLTGALGIAAHVAELYASGFGRFSPLRDPVWPRVPMLAQHEARPWQSAGGGGIVCHCESVTQSEILAALAGPLPAGSLGGLRRRTRCMNGRCQGFYCTRNVLALVDGRIPGLPAARDAA